MSAKSILETAVLTVLTDDPRLDSEQKAAVEFVMRSLNEAGYAIVPVDPTIEMVWAGWRVNRFRSPPGERISGVTLPVEPVWREMIAAALDPSSYQPPDPSLIIDDTPLTQEQLERLARRAKELGLKSR